MKSSEKNKKINTFPYLPIMATIFPLFITDHYYHIQESKSLFFIIFTFLSSLIVLLTDLAHKNNPFPSLLQPAKISYVIFLFTSFISSVLSFQPGVAFTGFGGRCIGWLFLLSGFLCLHLSSLYEGSVQRISVLLLSGACAVSLIGILNFMNVDLFGLVSAVPDYLRGRYLSTIGYSNFYSEYLAIFCILGIVYYIIYSGTYMFPLIFILYVGLLIGNSDSGPGALIILLFILPVFYAGKKDSLKRLSEILLPFPLSCLTARLLYDHSSLSFMDLGLPFVLTRIPVLFGILVFLLLLFLLLHFTGNKTDQPLKQKTDTCKKIWVTLLLIIFSLSILFFLLSQYGIISVPFLQTGDHFASNRGFIWKQSLMLFLHSPLKNKLIGYGPDTFYLLYEQNLGNQMESLTGQIYDSPHSVILQYLLSCGIIGILLLLISFLQILYRSIRSENDNRLLFLFPLLCYILQALVVPSTSMVTPYYFLFAGLLSRISFEQNPSLSNCSSLLEKKRQTCVTGTQK